MSHAGKGGLPFEMLLFPNHGNGISGYARAIEPAKAWPVVGDEARGEGERAYQCDKFQNIFGEVCAIIFKTGTS